MSAFKIKVNTENPGTSNNDQFTLPLNGTVPYNFTVDWGDTTSQVVITNTNITHTYPAPGIYEISITEVVAGGFPLIYFNDEYDKLKCIELSQWGTNRWDYMLRAFYGCANMDITAIDHTTALTTNAGNWNYAFAKSGITHFPLIPTGGDMTLVGTFMECFNLVSMAQINTANTKDFTACWLSCTSLINFPLLNMSAGNTFTQTWQRCYALTSFPITNFPEGYSFNLAWKECRSLIHFPTIIIPKALTLSSAWYGCECLLDFPLIDTSSVTDISFAWRGCRFTSFPAIDTSNVTNFLEAWVECEELASFPIIDTSKGTDFRWCWYHCSSLTSFPNLSFAEALDMYFAWGACENLIEFLSVSFPKVTSFDSAWISCVRLKNFPQITAPLCVNYSSAFHQSQLSNSAYSYLLKKFSENNLNAGVLLHGGTSLYFPIAKGYRDILMARGWNITDSGQASSDGEGSYKSSQFGF